ncbi:hypothetical protein BS78_04G123600 [Paspalum vaginatum]|nr:hypothetical protein BS78_04G123600 [Paspalum vaginatum]
MARRAELLAGAVGIKSTTRSERRLLFRSGSSPWKMANPSLPRRICAERWRYDLQAHQLCHQWCWRAAHIAGLGLCFCHSCPR